MRLVTYDAGQGPRAGILREELVLDVWGEEIEPVREADRTLGGLLRGGLIGEVDPAGEARPVTDVRLLPPLPDPGKIVCLGLNYRSHAEEAGLSPPEIPTFFAKFQNSLAPPGAEVALPGYSDTVDYEAEVAFVIGSRCRAVTEARALDHVAGYMLFCDLSARDYQFMTPQWMPGKVFDGSAPCGPALVTPDEAGAHDSIQLELKLNGETMQAATTGELIHSVPALVAHLSKLMTLEPGDIVSTGTPAGVGGSREPPVWLKPGDEVVISSPTLGTLETRLVAPA
jgi:2-keto-4-pentenoate hydratase/2-oxohepta-3-ene-1,7-dioic acid hydratase in catechol pathway